MPLVKSCWFQFTNRYFNCFCLFIIIISHSIQTNAIEISLFQLIPSCVMFIEHKDISKPSEMIIPGGPRPYGWCWAFVFLLIGVLYHRFKISSYSVFRCLFGRWCSSVSVCCYPLYVEVATSLYRYTNLQAAKWVFWDSLGYSSRV